VLTLTELQNMLRREMEDPVTGRGGAHVTELSDGSEIFQYEHLTPRAMASTTKIFTAGAALRDLGSETRFSTRLFAAQLPDADGTLHGDLYVVGGGDPTLGDANHIESMYSGDGTSVDRIIEAVTAAGIGRIKGGVVGDGSLFDTSSERAGHIAALTYNRNGEGQPVLHAAQQIRTALMDAGTPVEGVASEGAGSTTRMHEVGTVWSPTVMSLVTKSGYDSDNFVAETITKLLAVHHKSGVPSTEAGAAIVERFAAETGAALDIVNGSGLGPPNMCSPAAITAYLTAMSASEHATELARTMPRAGVEGTLEYRMRNTWAVDSVRAKTGTLTRNQKPLQDSLAGYCTGPRRTVAFSFVFEQAKSRYSARASIDRMTNALAIYCRQSKRSEFRSWFRRS
jgi:serine-type D-Ala-D-Ala carboxypeptidase/endopeptidase (penicillin-binding protein 4)